MGTPVREPSTVGEAGQEPSPGASARGATPDPAWTGREATRKAAGSVARLAPVFGWGLLALGLLAGLERILGPAALHFGARSDLPYALVAAAAPVVAFGLAGLATAVLCRLVATLIVEQIDRADRSSDEATTRALERIARALE